MVVSSGVADVSTKSSERSAMDRDLDLIAHIREGGDAIRRHCARYLPKYENESSAEYQRRVLVAPWRPEFADTLRFLASKPFGADVTVADDTPMRLAELVEDIDGAGNNITRFARHAFNEAIANGVHGIMVDYPVMPLKASLAYQKKAGARPYWVHIPVTSIIALRTNVVNGREVVTHVRFYENVVEPDGFGEKTIDQIRVVEPDHWEVWQKIDNTGVWHKTGDGPIVRGGKTADEVPFALLFTGERLGQIQTRPPLRDLAEVQIELYRALSRQDEILTFTGSPMLAAVGMSAPTEGGTINIGPKTILFAPPVGEGVTARWEFISPDASALGEIRQHIASIVEDMHRLGLQPTTTRSGSQTATMASIAASKAHSVLEAWAIGLKDCLEHAFQFTARWLAIDHDTTVQVFTDFAVGAQNVDESELLLQAEGASVISKLTAREELHRRNILGPQYDPKREVRRLAREAKAAPVVGSVPVTTPAAVVDPAEVPPVPGTEVDIPPEPLITPPTAKRKRRATV